MATLPMYEIYLRYNDTLRSTTRSNKGIHFWNSAIPKRATRLLNDRICMRFLHLEKYHDACY